MPGLTIILNGDGAWQDLAEKRDKVLHLSDPDISIARLPGGMKSGASSVMIRINLTNGTVIIAETSMKLFLGCAYAFMGAENNDGSEN